MHRSGSGSDGEHLIFCTPSAIPEETPCVGGVLYVGKRQILEQIQTGVQKNQTPPNLRPGRCGSLMGDEPPAWTIREGRWLVAEEAPAWTARL